MDAGLVKGEGFAVDASIIKADASRQRGVPGDEQINWSDPALSTRAVREYLEGLDEEALAETLPKRLSLTDPQARWTAAPGGPAFYAYSTNYLTAPMLAWMVEEKNIEPHVPAIPSTA